MRMTPQMSANFCWKKMEEIIEKINYYIQLMLMYAQTFGKVKATVFFQCTNEEFSTKRHRPKKTNKQKTLNIPMLKSLQPICIFLPQL